MARSGGFAESGSASWAQQLFVRFAVSRRGADSVDPERTPRQKAPRRPSTGPGAPRLVVYSLLGVRDKLNAAWIDRQSTRWTSTSCFHVLRPSVAWTRSHAEAT
jgi:hypothetical protein